MAYNYNNHQQSQPQQSDSWGQPTSSYSSGQPYPANSTSTIDATLSPQPAYQAPQFAPPVKHTGDSMIKTLNFFSPKPSYQHSGAGESSLTSPLAPPIHNNVYGGVPTQQKYGAQPVGLEMQTSPPAYNPATSINPYSPQAPPGQPGYSSAETVNSVPFQQQQQQEQYQQLQYPQQPLPHQPYEQQYQHQPYEHQQHQIHQPLDPQQPQQPHQPYEKPYEKQHQQPQHQLYQPHEPQQVQQPLSYQSHQQPTHNTLYPPAPTTEAPPAAYAASAAGAHAWPEKPTIQSTHVAAPTPATAHLGQGALDNTRYWTVLVEQSKIPLAPKPQLRSLFRGIAACINKECNLDKTPQCVLSPAKMCMYYGVLVGYGSRESQLFSRAQTAPITLTTLYTRLEVEHVLIPSNPSDGRRKPHSPALTITGFEHWLLLNVLLNPEVEYQRIAAFISASSRQILDEHGNLFPASGFPREALPAAPDAFVVKRYGGYMQEALASAGNALLEEDLAEEEKLRKEIETLQKRLFENKGELEKRNSELEKQDGEMKRVNAELGKRDGEMEKVKVELEKSNAELGRTTQLLAKATAAADEAVTRISGSMGVVLPDDRMKQSSHSYSPYTSNPQQHQQYPPYPAEPQKWPEQAWPPQNEQYPPQQQRRQSEQRPQALGQNPQQQQQQQSYYRQPYQPAR